MPNILIGFFQAALILFLAPLVNGLIKKSKAYLQNRLGPSVFQGYFDLYKLFRKDRVISEHSSWIFHVTPVIVFSSILATCFLVPVISVNTPLGFSGDLLAFAYLFALARFFTALAGIDAGSSFGGMGSSREITFAAAIEPAMLLSLFTVALASGATGFSEMVKRSLLPGSLTTSHLLAFLALYTVFIAETGRIPVDNPDTHLELTMIHEGMILEYSGRELALMTWAANLKQLVLITLLANLFFPLGIAGTVNLSAILIGVAAYLLKTAALAISLAVVETAFAKMRLFKVPKLLAASFLLSFFALVTFYVVGGTL